MRNPDDHPDTPGFNEWLERRAWKEDLPFTLINIGFGAVFAGMMVVLAWGVISGEIQLPERK